MTFVETTAAYSASASNAGLAVALPRTVVADPPWWPSLHKNTKGRTEGPYRAGPQRYYRLMEVEDIEAMAPETQAKAHLWLWVLNQHLDWGVRVARAWGFEPQQTLTWCKPGYGTGQFQCNSEQVLLCRKGGPAGNAFGKTGGTWFEWPRRRHSEKPEGFYDLVERASPGPYLEMFARRSRPGWMAMGDQLDAAAPILATANAKSTSTDAEHSVD